MHDVLPVVSGRRRPQQQIEYSATYYLHAALKSWHDGIETQELKIK